MSSSVGGTGGLFIFARHGETDLNAAGRFRGRADPPLTTVGEAQAGALGGALVEYAPAALYVSPRARARATAGAVAARTGLQPTVTTLLDDFDYGAWQGKTHAEVAAGWPELYAAWLKEPGDVSFPDGEPVGEAVRRITDFFRFVRDTHGAATVVAVTHDAMIRCALCVALEIPLRRYHSIAVDLTSTTGFVTSSPTRLAWANETAHVRAARLKRG